MRDELLGICPDDPLTPLSWGATVYIEYGRTTLDKIAICL